MEVRVARASAVIVQRVPPEAADWFLEWERGITAAAETFAGYRATDVYAPTEGQREEWVVLIHFDKDTSLQQWLSSPERAQWVEKLRAKIGDFELKMVPGGFGFWFAGLLRNPDTVPASWKLALTVLLGLYPTVMLLTIFVGPYTEPLGPAVSMLIGNALSVSLLQWAIMPGLTALLGPWLKADAARSKGLLVGGLCLLLLLLATMTLLFRLVTG